ncbi:MAG: rhodanese-like domain-containing protein [Chitinophagales bacterium]|nr:rhodanese-like domain-containing protein [Chitinophagales bacterium]HAE14631.1 NADH oxidase [Bacteroidota bacterium]HAE36000.1 NADH oxidase [Bacteroidota bacterium]
MEIDVLTLKSRLDAGEDLLLIDVREPYELEEFSLDAVNIPLATIPVRMYDFDDDLDREIVVFCRSGVRSAAAQAMLKQAGFTSVLNLSGGVLAWMEQLGSR